MPEFTTVVPPTARPVGSTTGRRSQRHSGTSLTEERCKAIKRMRGADSAGGPSIPLLHDQHAEPGAYKLERGKCPSRPGADDDRVKCLAVADLVSLANRQIRIRTRGLVQVAGGGDLPGVLLLRRP